jgi:hypothetical protein
VIAEVVENDADGSVSLKSPFEFIFTPQGAGLIPFMAMAKDHIILHPKSEHIVFVCEPAENLLEEYERAANPSPIETPKKPGLLVPGQ